MTNVRLNRGLMIALATTEPEQPPARHDDAGLRGWFAPAKRVRPFFCGPFAGWGRYAAVSLD